MVFENVADRFAGHHMSEVEQRTPDRRVAPVRILMCHADRELGNLFLFELPQCKNAGMRIRSRLRLELHRLPERFVQRFAATPVTAAPRLLDRKGTMRHGTVRPQVT